MTESGKVLFIVNPVAGGGRPLSDIPKIYETYGEDFEYEIITTIRAGHAEEIARDAKTFSAIVAVGGDGTIHEVINGIMQRPADDRPVFSIIPAGSGNDYANALNISTKVKTALKSFLNREERCVDLVRCNDEWFCDTFALGIDARIAQGTTELRKTSPFSGFLLYFQSLVNTFLNDFNTIKATVTFDGGEGEEREFLLLASTKGPTYGGGFKITPSSKPDNGVIETCEIAPVSRFGVLWRLVLLMFGKHTNLDVVTMGKHKKIVIESETPMMGALDGETRVSDRFELEIHERALRVR